MTFAPIIPTTGVAGYAYLERTRTDQQALLRASPDVSRDLEAFSGKIADIQTPDDLLNDYQLLKVALGAFGLDDDIGNRGFLKAVLDSDTGDSESFVNRLADKRYLEFAEAFSFVGAGRPQLHELKTVDAVKADIQALETVDDLLSDTALLRAALSSFGLEADVKNTHFLKLVLNSDVSDPTSFANTLSDPRYAQMSESFGFGAKLTEQNSIFAFADLLAGAQESFVNTEAVLAQPEIINQTAAFFGINDTGTNTDFWGQVLDSDANDPNAFVNQLSDTRYAAMSRMFGFGDPDRIQAAQDAKDVAEAENPGSTDPEAPLELEVSPLITAFTEALTDQETPYTDTSDFFTDFDGVFATLNLMDLPRTDRFMLYAGRVLESDPTDPSALVNLERDPRYAALQSALNFQPVQTGQVYPDGFADAIAQRYVDNQFEIEVGTVDQSMRLALAFESDLGDVVSSASTVDSQWYAVMASGPLREIFETLFNLPDGFGTLDVDQQLTVFKERSEAQFGSSDLAVLNTEETRNDIRNAFLLQSDLAVQSSFGSSPILTLLSG